MALSSEKKSANAVGGKTARACDSCLRRRARWFCAADDAFLCQNCDHLVHSANPLARRHERVRLKTSSSSSSSSSSSPVKPADEPLAPSWHNGFKRKARTPRGRHHPAVPVTKSEPLVPDAEAHETGEEEEEGEEEQLLYRVPIFDPLLAEFCSSHGSDDSSAETKALAPKFSCAAEHSAPLPGFSPSDDVDMGEFSADVESLLGRVLDEDDFTMEGLGLVKLETSEADEINYDDSGTKRRKIALRLNYDEVISAWASGSPWTDGERPLVNPDECLPDFIGLWGEMPGMGYGGGGGVAGGSGDGGREARVSRYREKRRTRLFSKKIRYEVRKLNAEKRPRMKGRFVKSASFGGAVGAPAGVPSQPAFAF